MKKSSIRKKPQLKKYLEAGEVTGQRSPLEKSFFDQQYNFGGIDLGKSTAFGGSPAAPKLDNVATGYNDFLKSQAQFKTSQDIKATPGTPSKVLGTTAGVVGAASTANDLIQDKSSDQSGGSYASAAVKGATAGMAFGPIGAAVGAAVGLGAHYFTSEAAKKEEKEFALTKSRAEEKITNDNSIYKQNPMQNQNAGWYANVAPLTVSKDGGEIPKYEMEDMVTNGFEKGGKVKGGVKLIKGSGQKGSVKKVNAGDFVIPNSHKQHFINDTGLKPKGVVTGQSKGNTPIIAGEENKSELLVSNKTKQKLIKKGVNINKYAPNANKKAGMHRFHGTPGEDGEGPLRTPNMLNQTESQVPPRETSFGVNLPQYADYLGKSGSPGPGFNKPKLAPPDAPPDAPPPAAPPAASTQSVKSVKSVKPGRYTLAGRLKAVDWNTGAAVAGQAFNLATNVFGSRPKTMPLPTLYNASRIDARENIASLRSLNQSEADKTAYSIRAANERMGISDDRGAISAVKDESNKTASEINKIELEVGKFNAAATTAANRDNSILMTDWASKNYLNQQADTKGRHEAIDTAVKNLSWDIPLQNKDAIDTTLKYGAGLYNYDPKHDKYQQYRALTKDWKSNNLAYAEAEWRGLSEKEQDDKYAEAEKIYRQKLASGGKELDDVNAQIASDREKSIEATKKALRG